MPRRLRIPLLSLLALALLGADATPARDASPSEATQRSFEAAPADADAQEIARRAEDQLRAGGTYMRAEMTVESPRLAAPRVVSFASWDDRAGERSFIHILGPAKDRDTTFLKLEPNLWMYIPRVERTMRIPPSMMLQSWMGSDFTNDDLVKDSSEIDDYDHRLLGIDPNPESHPGRRAFVVEYTPHENVPVVWGRILAWIDSEHYAPLLQEFYDEGGEKLRVMRFSDYGQIEGRHFPRRWEMVPLDKQGHSTTIRVLEVAFDPEIDPATFTKRNLTRRR